MRQQLLLSLAVSLLLLACKPQNHFVKTDNNYLKVEEVKQGDTAVAALIAPYKQDVDKEMKSVIGEVAKMLTKAQPESTLGNWSADAIYQKAADYTQQNVDFAILNYGGLRIPSMPAGKITKGKIFELMPFDNMVVVIEMQGKDLPEVFDHLAASGGWPVSKHVKMTMHNSKAQDVRINGKKVDKDKTYKIATIDYVANGGNDCTFFVDKKQIATGRFFRDALIEYIEELTAAGKKVDANIEKRVIIIK